jgi:hypothetical protein
MGFLSYGSAKAISQTHDFQKDIDRLYQREAYAQQIKAEKEKKAMFYASLMKEQTAAAPVNTRKLESLYEGLHKQVADFAINNPGWETDVTKVNEFQNLTSQFIDNPIIREDQQVQQQWNATKEAYGKGDLHQDEYEKLAEQYHNYTQGLDTNPYVFANPKRKDMPTILKEINDYLAPVTTEVTDQATGKKTKWGRTPDENIHLAAVMGLRDRDTDFVVSKIYDNLGETEKGLYASKTDYFEHMIKYGEPMVKEDAGYDEMLMLQTKKMLDNKSDLQNYHRFYQNQVYEPLRTRGETSADKANISFTEFGDLKQPLAMGPNGRNLKMYNSQNNNSIEDVNVKGNVVSTGAGKIVLVGNVPWVQTQVMVSLDDNQQALDASGKPIETPLSEEEKAKQLKKKGDSSKVDQTEKVLLAKSLADHGFTVQKVTDPGMMASLGLEGSTVTSDVYVGTILTPADFSEGNRMKYDGFYGATKENLAKGAPLYNEGIDITEVLQSGNAPVASSMINKNVSKNISVQLKRNVGNLGWSQDEKDPYVWYSEDKENDYKYDFRTNKWFHSKK